MIYKMNPQLRRIKAPVISLWSREKSFGDAEKLTGLDFDRNYVVDSTPPEMAAWSSRSKKMTGLSIQTGLEKKRRIQLRMKSLYL